MIQRVLVANRGEIAVRVIRACRVLGIEAVAICSDADQAAMHVRLADDVVHVGPSQATHSYLNMAAVVAAAKISRCDAVHPGYGFLAENARFAELCGEQGLIFVGPEPSAIRMMAEKDTARTVAAEANVPIIEGTDAGLPEELDLREEIRRIGLPVLIKAAAGGGGRGMWLVREETEFPEAVRRASAEAAAAFGDGSVYVEKYIGRARHVEVQVLADAHGNVIHLGERDCSAQRRHQKLVEEAPSNVVDEDSRRRLCEAAVRLTKRCGYRGAGTVEFLFDLDSGKFYFIEMNTRIQVEHPVTEMVTGIDLVVEQLRIASGEPLSSRQEDVFTSGHAIECRINAEDVNRDFAPAPGLLTEFAPPGGAQVRCDTHCYTGYEVPPYYDSMLAKVIVHGRDRDDAIQRMQAALAETNVDGVATTIDFHKRLLASTDFRNDSFDTAWVEKVLLPAIRIGETGECNDEVGAP
ncbi:MAG: acetyl-CoA carboxylase biotin carboxylase subunit [Ectothiorhodospiraceae bacterium]|nr:acetyl-CoA carboxylase biotin carboxylase subunit [Ectothiorhodospiraceae bacterium]